MDDLIEKKIEKSVGELYSAFYQLRSSGQLKREYDTMGTLLDMLMKDRNHLRSKLDKEQW